MKIQHSPTFTAKIKINNINLKNLSANSTTYSPHIILGSSGVGSSMSGTASGLAGSTADVIGTAFSSKASGINSSGIVPSVLDSAAPYATPETIISANNHPSTIGSIFSTIGSDLKNMLKSSEKSVKDPY